MPRDTDPNTPVTVVVGIVGAVLLFVIVVLLQALFYDAERGEVARKVAGAGFDELTQLRTQQDGLLHSAHWVDQQKGIVAIPIERAMELLVERGRGGAVSSTTPTGAGAPSGTTGPTK